MAHFAKYLPLLLRHEGGYVNDKDDPGGETKYGISKKSYPKEDIKNLTVKRAAEIHKANYWDRLFADKFRNQSVAEIVVDHAVNAGRYRAVRLLQYVLNKDFNARLVEDGVMGPKTLKATNAADQKILFREFWNMRMNYYEYLADDEHRNKYMDWYFRSLGGNSADKTKKLLPRPTLKKYIRGWRIRVNSFVFK